MSSLWTRCLRRGRTVQVGLCGAAALVLFAVTPWSVASSGDPHVDDGTRVETTPSPGRPDVPVSEASAPPPATRCRVPRVPIPRTPGCEAGRTYPDCQWRMPHPALAGYLYERWRHTTDPHWWGRPALVSLVLAAARDYARHYPGEPFSVGDLDAPGPRHETHRSGVDVDLYLPGAMQADNEGEDDHPSNYDGRPRVVVRLLRQRVVHLARILTRCTQGKLRIYYRDRVVKRRFNRWFARQGFRTPFDTPMQLHNRLHRFHFHVTIADDLEPLPSARR